MENTHVVKTYPNFETPLKANLPVANLLTLTAHDGRDALPSPILLEVHASIARILHATGMGELIERILRERDEIGQCAANGSTELERLLVVL